MLTIRETKKVQGRRHNELSDLIHQLIEAARDSDMLDAGYYISTIENMVKPEIPIFILPENPWKEGDNRGANPDRRMVVGLYMNRVKAALENFGIKVA